MKPVTANSPASRARRIALLYALPALLWLIVGDAVNDVVVLDPILDRVFAIALVGLFVLVSAGLLYWLLRREFEQLDRSRQLLSDANAQITDSEARLRFLFEHAPVGIALIRNVELVFANPALARMFGYADLASLRSKPLQDHFMPGALDILVERIRGREPGLPKPAPYEITALHQDGSPFEVEINSERVELADGPAVFAFLTDITERKRAEAALRASEERFQQIAEHIREVFWLADTRTGTMLYVSPAYADIWGRPHQSLYDDGSSFIDTVHPDDRDQVIASLEQQAAGQPTEREYRVIQPGGQVRWILDRGFPVLDAAGRVYRVAGFAEDITRRKQAEAEIKQRLAELEAISRISTALRTNKTLEEMLPPLLAEAIDVLRGSAGSVWLYDDARDEIRMAHERGWGLQVGPFQRGEGITGHVIATGQPYLSCDLKSDPHFPDSLRAVVPANRAGICVPIRHGDQIIGALFVNGDSPRVFSAGDLRLLVTLAELAGSAIHRMQLLEQTERRFSHLSALRAIDQAISGSLDAHVTLEVILDQATQQLKADAAAVLLFDKFTSKLTYAAGRGFRTAAIRKTRLSLGEGTSGQAARERRMIRAADLHALGAGFARRDLLAGEGFVGYVAMPLVGKGELQGVLEIFQRSPLAADGEWLGFLEALAGQAAIAIDSARLFDGLQRSNIDLELAYDATIEGWSRALDLRDKETEGHSQRVTRMAEHLAQTLGLSEIDLVHLRRGALLHDIGKMGVPDGILLKPAALAPGEWAIMRQHPTFAYEMLSPIQYLKPALDIPYCHHEKWDGTGYPRGLKGEQIPLAARIFAVVDVWDALRSDRPYRPAWSADAVRTHIQNLSGSHFDPSIAKAFLNMELTDDRL